MLQQRNTMTFPLGGRWQTGTFIGVKPMAPLGGAGQHPVNGLADEG